MFLRFFLGKYARALAYVRKKQYLRGHRPRPIKRLAHLENTFLSHVNVRTIITRNAAHTTDTHTFFENMAVPPH